MIYNNSLWDVVIAVVLYQNFDKVTMHPLSLHDPFVNIVTGHRDALALSFCAPVAESIIEYRYSTGHKASLQHGFCD